jgi:hypothetical protein
MYHGLYQGPVVQNYKISVIPNAVVKLITITLPYLLQLLLESLRDRPANDNTNVHKIFACRSCTKNSVNVSVLVIGTIS